MKVNIFGLGYLLMTCFLVSLLDAEGQQSLARGEVVLPTVVLKQEIFLSTAENRGTEFQGLCVESPDGSTMSLRNLPSIVTDAIKNYEGEYVGRIMVSSADPREIIFSLYVKNYG